MTPSVKRASHYINTAPTYHGDSRKIFHILPHPCFHFIYSHFFFSFIMKFLCKVESKNSHFFTQIIANQKNKLHLKIDGYIWMFTCPSTQAWLNCNLLESLHQRFDGLCDSLVDGHQQWQEYFQASKYVEIINCRFLTSVSPTVVCLCVLFAYFMHF